MVQAPGDFRSSFEEDLSCPVCCDVFVNPVVLSCSHSICEDCVQRFWENKSIQECPVCRRRSSKEHPPVNLALKNLCETYQQKQSRKSSFGGESVCGLHKEKLKLFCLDDQEPLCLVCRDSRKHTNHRFCPVDEAHAERRIKAEFEELHQFLRDEEAARITILREEEKQRSQMMKQKIDETSRQISSLSCTIRDTEEQMKDDDVSFLTHSSSDDQFIKSPDQPEAHCLAEDAGQSW
uniref:RING-type domain-containing protein n=1 Tax=Sinocyclocheilus rhinocerous TaxID=307959 RepID=A0A673IG87_9TELE